MTPPLRVIATFLLLAGLIATVGCQTPPLSVTGLSQLTPKAYLVVQDTKSTDSGRRLGILELTDGQAPQYSELGVDWRAAGGFSSDVESLCEIAGMEGHYLAVESGYWKGQFGRIFHLQVERRDGKWQGRIVGHGQLPPFPDQIEGVACVRGEGDTLVLYLCQRGSEQKPAVLVWGKFDIAARRYTFETLGEFPFTAPDLPWSADTRDCSDLHLDGAGRIWCAAAQDGGDGGPFRSVIFQIGRVGETGAPEFLDVDDFTPVWILDGLKVEALADWTEDDLSLCVGTDDEQLGGVWRPLFPPRD